MRKKLTALLLGITIALTGPLRVFAITGEQRVALDPSGVEIINVVDSEEEADEAETDEAETEVQRVEVYEDIEISTPEELKQLSLSCRLDTWSVDKRIILMNDITVYESDFISIPTFGGYFEGQGHSIKGISAGRKGFVGLFNYTQPTAVISNLNVEGILRPEGDSMVVGGVVGDNYGIIQNCSFAGTIKGKDYIGGIAGYNEVGGSIIECRSYGKITGVHYTGGICGQNAGGIANCENASNVNMTLEDTKSSVTNLNLDTYKESLLTILNGNDDEKKSPYTLVKGSLDSGGIAGVSFGAITGCVNRGIIGYEHVGYNTGGIVGRSSGYVAECENKGQVYGRKDIGGIVGQAEPYVQLDLTQDIIAQITENVGGLHDMIETTLADAGNTSDTITMRLNLVKSFADKALDDTNYLANNAENLVDNTITTANEAINRIDFAMKELDKEGGFFDNLESSASEAKSTMSQVVKTVKDIDIMQYMSEEDREAYEYLLEQMDEASEGYSASEEIVNERVRNVVLGQEIKNPNSNFYKALDEAGITRPDLSNVYPYDADKKKINPWPDLEDYSAAGIGYFEGETYVKDFPSQEDLASDWYPYLEKVLDQDTKDYEAGAVLLIQKAVDEEYMKNHGGNERKENGDGANYGEQMVTYITRSSQLLLKYTDELTEQEQKDLKNIAGYAGKSLSELGKAGESARDIISDLNGRAKLVLPTLGDEFHVRTNSLNTNMQGISDNLGFLNQELNGSAHTLIGDLGAVNDQFNKLMLLITDAMDGALEMDYSTTYEDNSDDVAETCIDGTVADSVNNGVIRGDLNVGGIAGTMAIEYEFDLESDMTGIKDARLNSTYLSKCVLRKNVNNRTVNAVKSYIGGVVGLQEMGTVLQCENYGKIKSDTGDYVGGIAGHSLSTIKKCSANSIEYGRDYIGGIVGKGDQIFGCFSIPNIENAENYYGAVAGDLEDSGMIKDNYYCGSDYSGIDQISLQGKAEPVSYEELLGMEGVPGRFRSFMVSFTMDEEEIGSIPVVYGDRLMESRYPEPVLKEGYYAEWEVKELPYITTNVDVQAEEHKFITSLAGERLRDNGQSMLLVDGNFREGDAISVENVVALGIPVKNVTEHFVIDIPDDGELTHTVRYQPLPDEEVLIYNRVGGDWRKVKTEEYSGYQLFETSGNTVELAVSTVDGIDRRVYIIGGAVAVVVLILLLLILHGILNKKRRINSGKENR